MDGGLCYPKCSSGYERVGPVCWQKCPASQPVECGMLCGATSAACDEAIKKMESEPLQTAGSALARDPAGVATGTVNTALAYRLPKCGL